MGYSINKSISYGNKYLGIFFPIIFLLLILISIFSSQGCEPGDVPPDPSLDTALVTQLQTEYSTYGASTIPPFNAFTSRENSGYYSLWDPDHLTVGNGYGLNTSDSIYSGIAILRYYAPNSAKAIDLKADEVVENYYDIDTTAMWPVPISSAYRNPRRNNEKGGGQNSYHIYGRAIDFDNDNNLEHAQAVWDAISSTSPVELLNGANGRGYYTTRPSEYDDPICQWIHVAW